MNKKEREILSKIIAEMKYSNNTVHEAIDYADRILREFPFLKDDMTCEKGDVLEDNIVENIGIFLRNNNNPLALRKHTNNKMIQKWEDTKYTILWDLLDEEDITLSELEDITKDYEGVKRIVLSWGWRTVVKYHCEDGEFLKWCTKLL